AEMSEWALAPIFPIPQPQLGRAGVLGEIGDPAAVGREALQRAGEKWQRDWRGGDAAREAARAWDEPQPQLAAERGGHQQLAVVGRPAHHIAAAVRAAPEPADRQNLV